MTEVHHILDSFEPVTLDQMGSARLMDRRDTKFLVPREILAGILAPLSGDYRVLEIQGIRAPRYETDYFDTEEFTHFRQHQTRRMNRYKVRIRRYIESGEAFIELKFKNNHGRTQKDRIPVDAQHQGICEKGRAFLARNPRIDHNRLLQVLCIRFSRITLVHRTNCERVTLDIGLHYSGDGKTKSFDQLVIAEVKHCGRGVSPFVKKMRDLKVRPFSVSKYCLGIASLYGHLRHNLTKPKIRHINKLLYVPR